MYMVFCLKYGLFFGLLIIWPNKQIHMYQSGQQKINDTKLADKQ